MTNKSNKRMTSDRRTNDRRKKTRVFEPDRRNEDRRSDVDRRQIASGTYLHDLEQASQQCD